MNGCVYAVYVKELDRYIIQKENNIYCGTMDGKFECYRLDIYI